MEKTITSKSKTFETSTLANRGEIYFSADYVLDAYSKGREDGAFDVHQAFRDLLKRNIRDASKFTNSILNFMFERQFNVIDVFYRIGGCPKIDIMIAVPEEDYLKESFLDIYKYISNLEDEYNSESLTLDLTFIPANEHLSIEEIISDGFGSLKQINEAGARKA